MHNSLLTRKNETLRKAQEAEKEAEITDAQAAKDVWLRIAKSYRDLAAVISQRRGVF